MFFWRNMGARKHVNQKPQKKKDRRLNNTFWLLAKPENN